MNSLYFNILFCSWIYLLPICGYPIQGLDERSKLLENRVNYETALRPESRPQISKLIDSYNNLILADGENIVRDLLLKDPSQNIPSKTTDYSEYESQSNSVSRIDSDNSARPFLAQNPAIILDLPKREQGWYIQYGKRNIGNELTRDSVDNQMLINDDRNHQDIGNRDQILSLQTLMDLANDLSGYHLNLPKKFLKNSEKIHVPEYPSEQRNSKEDINKYKDKEQIFGNANQESKTAKPKREQGWFISYGKRSNSNNEVYFI